MPAAENTFLRNHRGARELFAERFEAARDIAGVAEKVRTRIVGGRTHGDNRQAGVNSDAKSQRDTKVVTELLAETVETVPDGGGSGERALGARRGIAVKSKHAHQAIARDAGNDTAVRLNDLADTLHIAVDDEQDIEGQFRRRKHRRVPQIDAHRCGNHFAALVEIEAAAASRGSLWKQQQDAEVVERGGAGRRVAPAAAP